MRLKKIIYVSLFSLGAMACAEDKGIMIITNWPNLKFRA